MSRKLLALLLAALLLLSLATYVYYRRTLAAVPVDPYALVPDDAVLVLSTRNHPALVRRLQEAGAWDNLTGVRYYQQVAGQLALADSLATGGNPAASQRRGLLSLLGNKLVLTSLHVTGPRQVDVLYQVPLLTVREYRQARGLLETLGRDHRYTLGTRAYEGQELQELTRLGGERLTLLNYRNHLVFSTNATLVEAVVQRLAHLDSPTVRAGFAQTDLLRQPDLDVTMLVNFRRLPGLLDVLFQPGTHARLDQALALARDGLLGLRLGAGQLVGTGFANPETTPAAWQSALSRQPPQALRPLAEVLPLRTALVLALAGRLPQVPATDSAARPLLDSLRATLLPGGTLVWLAAPSPGAAPGPVLLLRSRAPGRTATWLGRLRRAASSSPAFERVGRYELFEAPLTATQLAGPLGVPAVLDSAGTRTTLVGSFLVVGEATALRRYAQEVASGQVWSSSATQVALLQQSLPQAGLTVLADVRQGWNALLGALAEDRRAGLLRNESLLRRFPQLAWQLLPTDPAAAATAPGSYYAQLLLRRPSETTTPTDSVPAAGASLRFRTPLAGSPLLLSASQNAFSTVVADSSGVLRLLPGAPAALAWTDTLPGAMVSSPRPVRGRLLLATAHRVHWLSQADGREAPGFPLNLPDSAAITAVVGAASTPRLVVATSAPDLLLFDTNGRRYPGWPHRLEAPLAGPPVLLTVGGRDVVVAALRNGYVYAFDQAGGRFPGFPVSAGARLDGPVLATAGPTLAQSQLRLVNQHGELLTLTLSGDITARRRVATWSRTSTFRLVPEASGRGRSFVVVRQDGGQLDVYAPTAAAPLLSRQLLTSGPKPVQWFDVAPGHEVLALTEPQPGQVSLFTGRGQVLAPAQPSTGTGVALRYDAARRRYVLLRYQGRDLHREELAD